MNQTQDHLRALEKMIRINPQVVAEVGREVVNFAVAFKTAYMYFDLGSHKEARLYFAKAIRIRFLHWPSYGYYLACWLPPPWINGLRQLKRGFAKATIRTFNRKDTKALAILEAGKRIKTLN